MIELQDLLAATPSEVYGPVHATRFSDFAFDSRTLNGPSGSDSRPLFLAVKTETGDGHDYIAEAVRRGAGGVLCERAPQPALAGITCIIVPDTRQALSDWATYVLRQRHLEVIGVTGSSGKTTTKELVAAVLAGRQVFRNPGSYNGRFGLPIALGRLEPSQHLAVLELAADEFGEIQALAQMTRPLIGIVTAIHESHLDTFGTLDAIAQEKGALVAALPADGLAILNVDDPRVASLATRTPAPVLRVGFGAQADLRALAAADRSGTFRVVLGPQARALLPGRPAGDLVLSLQLLGRHQVPGALAALAVGLYYGLPADEVLDALSRVAPLPGRLCPLPGLGQATLIDDTANANPASMLAALDTLATRPGPRWAVLGDMADLGPREIEAHRRVGSRAAEVVERLIAVGDRSRYLAEAAVEAGLPASAVFFTYSNAEAARYVRGLLAGEAAGVTGAAGAAANAPPTILIKGGRAARLEQVVAGLLAPDAAAEAGGLLVRQDAGWRQVRLARPDRPTWLEVDLEAIAGNVRALREIVGPAVGLLAVLKADGYGHGAVRVARSALNNGAAMLGVACLAEAVTLRRAGIDAPILILGYTPPWQARDMILNQVTPTLLDLDFAQALSRALAALGPRGSVGRLARWHVGTLQSEGAPGYPVHVKVDTGMARLGLRAAEVPAFVQALAGLPGLFVEGLFTHFSTADSADLGYTSEQLARFQALLAELDALGQRPPLVHAANSAAALRLPESRFDLVRVGIALYGLAPGPDVPLPPGLRPALSWKTQIAQVKRLPRGSFVGYGNTYQTGGEQTIATVPVGYADGFRRAPQRWASVLVRGQRVPIAGRVSMDQTMLDVTAVPGVRQGDEVVLIGRQGKEEITVDEVAAALGTINYEVVSEILARVPRVV